MIMISKSSFPRRRRSILASTLLRGARNHQFCPLRLRFFYCATSLTVKKTNDEKVDDNTMAHKHVGTILPSRHVPYSEKELAATAPCARGAVVCG